MGALGAINGAILLLLVSQAILAVHMLKQLKCARRIALHGVQNEDLKQRDVYGTRRMMRAYHVLWDVQVSAAQTRATAAAADKAARQMRVGMGMSSYSYSSPMVVLVLRESDDALALVNDVHEGRTHVLVADKQAMRVVDAEHRRGSHVVRVRARMLGAAGAGAAAMGMDVSGGTVPAAFAAIANSNKKQLPLQTFLLGMGALFDDDDDDLITTKPREF